MGSVTAPGWIKFQHFWREDVTGSLFGSISHSVGNVSTAWGRRGDWGSRLFGSGQHCEAWIDDLTHVTTGFGFCFHNGVYGSFFQYKEGTAVHLGLMLNLDRSISVYRDTTATVLFTTDPGIAPENVQLFFVLEAVIDDAVGTIILHVDGAERINEINQDTKNGGTGVVNRVRWTGGGTGGDSEWSVKDMYVADADDADYHKMHDWRGEHLFPTSDIISDFVPSTGVNNWALVDELPADAADKVTSLATGDRDRYGHANGAFTYPIITMAVVANIAKDSGSATAKIGIYDGANLEQTADILASTTPAVHALVLTERPAAGGAWDATSRDASASDIENTT